METTIGRLLIDETLPQDMKGKYTTLDKKGVQKLFQELAERYPDKYREVAHKMAKLAAESAYHSGGYSFGLRHLLPSPKTVAMRNEVKKQVARILANPSTSDEQKEQEIVMAASRATDPLEKSIFEEESAAKNPLALQAMSGAKGSPGNLRSLLGADMLYVDHHDKEIPIPVLKSYSEGLSPAEYFAGTYGARRGIIDLKLSTRDAGYFSKLLSQASHRLLVTARDHDKPSDPDSPRGLPVPVDDPDNEGAFLAHGIGAYSRNTQLTAKVLADLKAKGIKNILVRSPLAGGPADGGVYAYDVGVRERGALAPIGDQVGIAAAQSVGEPVSQGSISSKHQGGVAGTGGGISGFRLLNQLTAVPSTFPGGAAHAQVDGRVERIDDAPQGGKFIVINGQQHYTLQDHDPLVKPGDSVEAGDVLSQGLPNPAEIVRHKGIGEGRRHFLEQFRRAAKTGGFNLHRRNLELVSRGLINHVRLHDEMGDHDPDDVVPYQTLEHSYKPRPGAVRTDPSDAMGKYLERPVLHYSIGTKVRPSMLPMLKEYGVKQLVVHHEEPPFSPVMVRAQDNLSHDPDWMTQMLGSNLQKHLLHGVHRGAVSDPSGTSYVPSLALGLGFGQSGKVHGFDPKELKLK